jgi:RHH-type transcriptional regulator, rel operon repressor / antitoxin RelB
MLRPAWRGAVPKIFANLSYISYLSYNIARGEMLSIRLKPSLEKRLSRLATQTGRTKTFYATKLIEENIEDLEDRYLAEARLEKRGKHYSSREVRSELGLED